MGLYRWDHVENEPLNPLLSRQVIHCRNLTVAHIHLKKGAVVPMHSHANEQVSILERGRLRFLIAGREQILEAGEMLHIEPDVPHEVTALEDSLALDLFSPAREDWRSGDDAYLRSVR